MILGVPDRRESRLAIFYYLNGKLKFVSNPHIFYCREKMQPSKWYYRVDEKLPERIEFKTKYSVNELMYKESAGHIKFNKMCEEYSIQGVADRFGLSINQIKNTKYKRMNPMTKKECFKSLPSLSIVLKLRDVINPDLWYIFPEELV